MPTYPVLRESFFSKTARETVMALGAEKPTDGIRIADEDGWFLIRASGTESKIRITAEGKTLQKAKELLKKGRTMITQRKTA
jgi:phosphoglucosamine mutase